MRTRRREPEERRSWTAASRVGSLRLEGRPARYPCSSPTAPPPSVRATFAAFVFSSTEPPGVGRFDVVAGVPLRPAPPARSGVAGAGAGAKKLRMLGATPPSAPLPPDAEVRAAPLLPDVEV
eukprot:2465846-Rhodomonas_salina.2